MRKCIVVSESCVVGALGKPIQFCRIKLNCLRLLVLYWETGVRWRFLYSVGCALWVLVLRCVIGVCSLRAVARLFLCEFSIYREGS